MNRTPAPGASQPSTLNRRTLLSGAAAGTGLAAAAALSGCTVPQDTPPLTPDNTLAPDPSAPPPTSQGDASPLASAAEVPSGAGLVLKEEKIVLTRAADGTARAFSAVCTHQGCTVTDVKDGTINCPCHQSKFDATTGQVVSGPATQPLAPVAVAERNGSIYPA